MKVRASTERPTLDLIEEAVHLLRSMSLRDFGWYLAGVLPFLLGLLYFCTDMSWSALAFEHRAEASLGMAILFVWMKSGQAIFAGKLHAQVARRTGERTTITHLFGVVLYQAIIQPSKLFVLPAAAVATLPFAWVFAFYENATVLGRGDSLRKVWARAWRLSAFSPRQNHGALSIYLLLKLIVFVNVATAVLLMPQLLKMFAGVETIFTRNVAALFNTTFFAIVIALTYVVCDPLLKAIYALRCFYAESIHSGADLMAELRTLPRRDMAPVAMLAICFLVPLLAAATPSAAPAPPIPPNVQQLDEAIEQTLKRSEFSWKLPRQLEVKSKSKWPFVESIERFLKATGRVMKRAFNTIVDWMDKIFAPRDPPSGRSGVSGWHASSRVWLVVLIVLLIVAAAALLVQAIRQVRLRKAGALPAQAPAPKIDLEDEAVTADLLPEDEWRALAQQHLAKGEMRLALRAFFLSGLAHLAARQILVLARHKSNRDYNVELRRKARDQQPVLEAFQQNIAAVERVWYGRHKIEPEGIRQVESNLDRIRAC